MSGTGMAGLVAAITKALLAGGVTVGVLLALLEAFLNAENRAGLIALTEIEKAIADGAFGVYTQLGVNYWSWITDPESDRCARCLANQAAGPQPVGSIWVATGTTSTPGHPLCRCHMQPSKPPAQGAITPVPGAAKSARERPVTDQHSSPVAGLAPRGSYLVPGSRPQITKAGKPWKHPDTSLPVADRVYAQLAEDYPPEAIEWVRHARWEGPALVKTASIDMSGKGRWAAGHEAAKVERFRLRIAKRRASGKPVKPVVLVKTPEDAKRIVVDGHHRTIAGSELPGAQIEAYTGYVDAETGPWDETHASQFSDRKPGAGDDGAAKNFTAANLGDGSVHGLAPYDLRGQEAPPIAAGLVVLAADTGRVLMLQRAVAENDPAAGYWELPGGHIDAGERAEESARREWAEETGCPVPDGTITGGWTCRSGVYQGFVLTIASEDLVPVHEGRDQVINPDDPDGDQVEAIAWWDVKQLPGNPAVRPELVADLDLLLGALAGSGA
jgi:8-oxo-dGTP pyrophosphatase MutT (NUDIX family)